MSHTADMNSKYALPKFKNAATSQKRTKTFVILGAGAVTLWMGALGAVAYSRNAKAQAVIAQQAAVQSPTTQTAPVAATQPPPQLLAQAEPAAAAADVDRKPVAEADKVRTKSSSRVSSHSKRSHSSRKSYASRSSSVSAKVSSDSGAKRMKDDQLDALLKQFK